jgi:hypothetical protein
VNSGLHVTHIYRSLRSEYVILVGKPRGKRLHSDSRAFGRIILKLIFEKTLMKV